MSVAGGLRPPA